MLGSTVGDNVGLTVGSMLGEWLGLPVGSVEGDTVGATDGEKVGLEVGIGPFVVGYTCIMIYTNYTAIMHSMYDTNGGSHTTNVSCKAHNNNTKCRIT